MSFLRELFFALAVRPRIFQERMDIMFDYGEMKEPGVKVGFVANPASDFVAHFQFFF